MENTGMNRIRNFLKSDDAVAITEYGLLIAMVALFLVAVVTIFGSQIRAWFGSRTSDITSV
jgi:Flp pilus assembly pilin Flp